nr:hypothetical protein Iba_chr12fCG17560 [Ipomoea batatas]
MKLVKIRVIPWPSRRLFLLLDLQAILLGTPLLNPPSISVYTTGSSLSAPLLPPENLPTANPPPGNLQMVKPIASSSFLDSAGSSWRQTGQEFRRVSHGRMQSGWYMCLHGISRASAPRTKASLQTAQCESEFMWLEAIWTVGIDSIAALDAGGFSGRPNPFISICASWSSNRSNPDPIKNSDIVGGNGRSPDPSPSS